MRQRAEGLSNSLVESISGELRAKFPPVKANVNQAGSDIVQTQPAATYVKDFNALS